MLYILFVGSAATKTNIVNLSDDYDSGLAKLWGENTLKQLREHIKRGDIEDYKVEAMANKMDALRIYKEAKKMGDLIEIFERLLREWFDETLFEYKPSIAKDVLVSVLKDGRCSKRVVSNIRTLCDSER